MVIYGVSLWGVGLVGGYWIAFNETPLGSPRGALGFWEAATVALGIAAISLAWLGRTCVTAGCAAGIKKGREVPASDLTCMRRRYRPAACNAAIRCSIGGWLENSASIPLGRPLMPNVCTCCGN